MSTYIGNNEISSIYVGNSEISSIYVGTDLVYSGGTTPPTPTGDTTNYLCFTAQQDNSTVALTKNGSPTTITLEYSLDKQTWNTWDRSAIALNSGDTMYLRGNNNGFSTSSSSYYKFVMSGSIAAAGSIMTLLDSTDTLRTVSNYMFSRLFLECSGLTDASRLELPATTIRQMGYESFFRKCQNLTTAPSILPATTLGPSCYQGMFELTQITTAPVLPATTLASYCYNSMFKKCYSLTTAPELPATTLVGSCYNEMFSGCTSLTSVTSYASNISAGGLNNWLSGVAETGTFYNYGGATYPSGASGIPSGWTEITS